IRGRLLVQRSQAFHEPAGELVHPRRWQLGEVGGHVQYHLAPVSRRGREGNLVGPGDHAGGDAAESRRVTSVPDRPRLLTVMFCGVESTHFANAAIPSSVGGYVVVRAKR